MPDNCYLRCSNSITIMKRLLIILASIACTVASFAQLDHIDIEPMGYNGQMLVDEVTQVFQDSEGFIWYGTNDGLCRDDGYNIHVFKKDESNPNSIGINAVFSIAEDKANHLWVGTENGLLRIDKETFDISRIDVEGLNHAVVNHLLASADGTVWAMGNQALFHVGPDTKVIKRYDMPEGISCIYEDSKQRLFVARNNYGLMNKRAGSDEFALIAPYLQVTVMLEDSVHNCYWMFDRYQGFFKYTEGKPGKLEHQTLPNQRQGDFYTHIVQDDNYHYIWALSYYKGLQAFKVADDGQLAEVSTTSFLPPINQILYSIMKSRNGFLWVTGFDTNSFIINLNRQNITYDHLDKLRETSHFSPAITSIGHDSGGIFWLVQKRNDLFLYNPETDEYVCASHNTGSQNLPLYMTDKLLPSRRHRSVWAIINGGKTIYQLERTNMQVRAVTTVGMDGNGLDAGTAKCAFEDSQSNLWIGTEKGICVYRHKTHNLEVISKTSGFVSDFTETKDGNVWCTVRNKGLARIDKRGKVTLFPLQFDLLTVAATSDGLLWIGTREGHLYLFEPNEKEGKQFSDYTEICGITSDKVDKILADCFDHLWIITSQRIKEFNPNNGAFRLVFAHDSRSQMLRFLPSSSFIDPANNQVYVGGIPGFVSFAPSQTLENLSEKVHVYITDIWTNGKSIWFDHSRHSKAGQIELDYDNHNVGIFFSSLNLGFTHNIRYAYKMEGIDDDWTVIKVGDNKATYNHLPKGKYIFKVKATDINGLWSDDITELTIIRNPAWYESGFAYFIYILLFLLILYLSFRAYKRHLDQKNQKMLQENITQAKMVYFTSISHELLTPLTIIKCLLEDFKPANEENTHKMELIKSNVVRLRRLLQQVLDFRKVESKNMRLYVEEGNITQFIQAICKESFEPLARNKDIQFLTMFSVSDMIGYFDRDKLEKILFNLISNAFKYTPAGRSVTLTARLQPDSTLWLSVKDEGVGIEQREQKFIFNRFYSSRKNNNCISNGIGLSLTKDLVELHHGTISVKSQLGKGSEFIVELPTGRNSFTQEEIREVVQDEQIKLFHETKNTTPVAADADKEKDNLLIVEDNRELLFVMQEVLSRHYNVFVATNGLEALDIVHDENIQAIISDISMPKMDGIELCRRIKQNIDTSHLIFVMLTANISSQSQIEAYNSGADAYVTKPFETEVLITLLRHLKEQRQSHQEEFKKNVKQPSAKELAISQLDQEFIDKAIQVVEKNMMNGQLDVEFLAREMSMSRSTFSRKIKAITGQTAFEFIKSLRLKAAYRMLEDSTRSVLDVMESVGYNDHRTFAQSFKDMFGMLPSEVK